MKKITLVIITLLVSISMRSQTAESFTQWLQQGIAAAQQNDYQEADRCFETFIAEYEKRYRQDNETYPTILATISSFYVQFGDYAKAVEKGTKALELRKTVLGEKHPDYISLLSYLASYHSHLGDYAKAAEMATQATELLRETVGEQHATYATSLATLASYQSQLGDNTKAVDLCSRALKIFKKTYGENHPDYATTMSNLAEYYADLGNYTKAVELNTKAMEIRMALFGENHPDFAISLINLSAIYSNLGDYTKAVELCTQAAEIYKQTLGAEDPTYATSLSNLANYYANLGNYDKAVELGMEALNIRREIYGKDHLDNANSLNNIAYYSSRLGDYPTAIGLGLRALDIFGKILGEKHPDYATTLDNIATYHAAMGEYDKAAELSAKSLDIRREVLGEKHPDYALSLNNLAANYAHLGNYVKALELGTKALDIRKSALGDRHPDYASTLGCLALYHFNLGNYSKMMQYYRENISILQDNTLQQFTGLTAKQRSMFWENNSYEFTDVYPSFTYLTHATTAPDLYNKSCLFAKGLLLSTEIEMNRLIQESGDAEALRMYEELQMNRLQLQKLYETPIAERHISADSLAQVVDRQEQALVKRSSVYGDYTRKLRTTWRDVQKALGKDEIAIEFLSFYLWNTDSTMVAALTLRKDDKEPKFIPLFEQSQLQSVSDQQYYNCPEVTALVWQPLQQELRGVKRIYFSPSGVLHNVGIEYAPGMENYEMYRLSTTREVITRTETHPNPTKGREKKTSTNPGEKEIVLFGGVDYNATLATNGTPPSEGTREVSGTVSTTRDLQMRGMSAHYLPETKTEVEGIKQSFDSQQHSSDIHIGSDATETSVKALSAHCPKILHIATHGFYFTDTPATHRQKFRFMGQEDFRSVADLEDMALTRSGLLMAGANGTLKRNDPPAGVDDGVLTAQEISRLDLRGLDLVVLSACKTGLGDLNQGEGVFGLQRGFKKAGVQTIVMSLWEVADEATQLLMSAFYHNLLQGHSKRDAFHNAQTSLRQYGDKSFDHPQFWAAFILLD